MNSPNIFGSLLTPDQAYEDLIKKYPWCSLVRLSNLVVSKKNGAADFEEKARMTALYFNNSHWLNWQLHLSGEPVIEVPAPLHDTSEIAVDENTMNNNESSLPIVKNEENSGIGEELIFEPLYTTDYFASQGIKLTDEPVSNDKLGTQVKSFTEWLKSMKKIHTEKAAEPADHMDKSIQQIAEHSNTDAEVVTEAMAEVLLKQQKYAKAIDVYRKLSLINPSKSAYFAAKINELSTDRQQ